MKASKFLFLLTLAFPFLSGTQISNAQQLSPEGSWKRGPVGIAEFDPAASPDLQTLKFLNNRLEKKNVQGFTAIYTAAPGSPNTYLYQQTLNADGSVAHQAQPGDGQIVVTGPNTMTQMVFGEVYYFKRVQVAPNHPANNNQTGNPGRSVHDPNQVAFQVVNKAGMQLKVIWVDYNGVEVELGEIIANGGITYTSHKGALFRFKNKINGALVAETVVKAAANQTFDIVAPGQSPPPPPTTGRPVPASAEVALNGAWRWGPNDPTFDPAKSTIEMKLKQTASGFEMTNQNNNVSIYERDPSSGNTYIFRRVVKPDQSVIYEAPDAESILVAIGPDTLVAITNQSTNYLKRFGNSQPIPNPPSNPTQPTPGMSNIPLTGIWRWGPDDPGFDPAQIKIEMNLRQTATGFEMRNSNNFVSIYDRDPSAPNTYIFRRVLQPNGNVSYVSPDAESTVVAVGNDTLLAVTNGTRNYLKRFGAAPANMVPNPVTNTPAAMSVQLSLTNQFPTDLIAYELKGEERLRSVRLPAGKPTTIATAPSVTWLIENGANGQEVRRIVTSPDPGQGQVLVPAPTPITSLSLSGGNVELTIINRRDEDLFVYEEKDGRRKVPTRVRAVGQETATVAQGSVVIIETASEGEEIHRSTMGMGSISTIAIGARPLPPANLPPNSPAEVKFTVQNIGADELFVRMNSDPAGAQPLQVAPGKSESRKVPNGSLAYVERQDGSLLQQIVVESPVGIFMAAIEGVTSLANESDQKPNLSIMNIGDTPVRVFSGREEKDQLKPRESKMFETEMGAIWTARTVDTGAEVLRHTVESIYASVPVAYIRAAPIDPTGEWKEIGGILEAFSTPGKELTYKLKRSGNMLLKEMNPKGLFVWVYEQDPGNPNIYIWRRTESPVTNLVLKVAPDDKSRLIIKSKDEITSISSDSNNILKRIKPTRFHAGKPRSSGPASPPKPETTDKFYEGLTSLGKGYNLFARDVRGIITRPVLLFDAKTSEVNVYHQTIKIPENCSYKTLPGAEFTSDKEAYTSARKVQRAYQNKLGVSGTYKGVTASVDTEFGSGSVRESKRSYVKYEAKVKPLYVEFPGGTPIYLAPDFQKAIRQFRSVTWSQNPQQYNSFFATYGTHVVRSVTLGASASMNSSVKHSSNLTENDLMIAASVSFEGKKVGGSVSNEYAQQTSRFESESRGRTKFRVRGGDPNLIVSGRDGIGDALVPHQWNSWIESTKGYGKLRDIEQELMPIWALAYNDDGSLDQAAMKNLQAGLQQFAEINGVDLDDSPFQRSPISYEISVELQRAYISYDGDAGVDPGDMYWDFYLRKKNTRDNTIGSRITVDERGRGSTKKLYSGNSYNWRSIQGFGSQETVEIDPHEILEFHGHLWDSDGWQGRTSFGGMRFNLYPSPGEWKKVFDFKRGNNVYFRLTVNPIY